MEVAQEQTYNRAGQMGEQAPGNGEEPAPKDRLWAWPPKRLR